VRDAVLARQRKPHFTPGTRYEYSNSNYLLLGDILERMSRGSPDAALQQTIAKPLGLKATSYADQPGLARSMAHGYERFDHAFNDHWGRSRTVPTDIVGPVWTDGGVITTAADAARFGDALWAGRILTPATLRTMIDPGGPGRAERYGLGTYSMREAGRTWQGHDGDYGGYQSMLFTDRAHHLTLAVIVNSDEGDVADVFSELADVLDPDPAG
jgi:D-alanyl-D-alanine carboxypeptidase